MNFCWFPELFGAFLEKFFNEIVVSRDLQCFSFRIGKISLKQFLASFFLFSSCFWRVFRQTFCLLRVEQFFENFASLEAFFGWFHSKPSFVPLLNSFCFFGQFGSFSLL